MGLCSRLETTGRPESRQRGEAGPEYGNSCVSSLEMYAAKRMPIHQSGGMPAMVALTRTLGVSNMGRSA
jgi:hypothetical protein